jgi:hypothetical protein
MASAPEREWQTESYVLQRDRDWPKEGRHILAQYDVDSVVVYQAYCPEIAQYAVEHQRLVISRWVLSSAHVCSFKMCYCVQAIVSQATPSLERRVWYLAIAGLFWFPTIIGGGGC